MAAKGFSTSNYVQNTNALATIPATIFCWFNPATYMISGQTEANSVQTLMFPTNLNASDDAIRLSVHGDRKARTRTRHGGVSSNSALGVTALPLNTWTAVAASLNSGGTVGTLWVNGASDATADMSARIPTGMTDVTLGISKTNVVGSDPILTGSEPKFRGAGAGDANAGDGAGGLSGAPAFPATVVNEDVAFLQLVAEDSGTGAATTINVPSGWTSLFNDSSAPSGTFALRQRILYKACDGTEGSSTVAVDGTTSGTGTGATKGLYGRIYVFSDVALSSFTESGGTGNGTDTSAEISSITSSVDSCLGMFFCAVANDVTQAAITGNTATWTETVAEFTSTTGIDSSIGLQTAVLATAGTFSGGNAALGAGPVGWLQRSFSLKPRNAGVQGKLAHCAVWNVELSAEDHAALAAGCSPLLVRPDALTFYASLLDNATLNEIVTVNTLTGSLSFEEDG